MNITRSEAAIFALAFHDACIRTNCMMPSILVLEVAARVDFKRDDLKQQVDDVVDQLRREHPRCEKSGAGERVAPVGNPESAQTAGYRKKVEATRDALVALGARVTVRRRQLAHRKKTYLYVVAAGGHFEWQSIIMPAIRKDFPNAYMTSGGFGAEMKLTIALGK